MADQTNHPKRQSILPKTWIKLADHPGWVLHEGNAVEWVEVHDDGTLVFGAAMRYSTHNPTTVADLTKIEWDARQAKMAEASLKIVAMIRDNLATDNLLSPSQQASMEDALTELEKIVVEGNHPDAVGHARATISSLAGLWFSSEEIEDRWLQWMT